MEVCFLCILVLLCCAPFSGAVLLAPPPRANSTAAAALRVAFYSSTCPQAEAIVQAQVQKRFLIDKTITPALLRMLFHDAFVRGADASILLDSRPGSEAEKAALPNLTIRGFDLINDAKDALEAACPGIVSCADIIVLAVRDSVTLAGGPKYDVPTGRLDGKVSLKEEALTLPSPAFPVEQSQESFRQKGLDLEDMVALLGAHTVGVALCGFFNDRLFNFHGTGAADPTMNPQLVTRLSGVCPNPFFTESNADPPIDLDQSTGAIFDSAYYSQIIAGNGILQIDQEITANPTTAQMVQSFTSTTAFFPAFVRSIIKMGNVDVITGNDPLGEVRRKCNVSNSGGAVRTPATPAPAAPVTKPPAATKPAPPGHATKTPPSKPAPKPAPPGHSITTPPLKPAPAGHVPRPPAVRTPAPVGPVFKPPPVAKPAPTGHVIKPPRTPVPKTPPVGHVVKPPRTPVPKTPPVRHVSKPPITPVTKPAPAGHPRKPSPSPIVKPPSSGHVAKPAPPRHVRSPAPVPSPTTKPPVHVGKQAPPRPVSKRNPTTPVRIPAPPSHGSQLAPLGPPGHIARPPTPSKRAPPGHVSSPLPHRVSRPAPSGNAGKPPVRSAPPQRDSTSM